MMFTASRSCRYSLTPSMVMHARNLLKTSRHITSNRLRVSSFSFAASFALMIAALRANPVWLMMSSNSAPRSFRKDRTSRMASLSPSRSSSSGCAGSSLPVVPPCPVSCVPEGCERLAQVLQNPAVVDDEPVLFAFVHPVGSRDGLHERVRPDGLLQVGREI